MPRSDPYGAWDFQVTFDGDPVDGVWRIGGIGWATEVLPYRNGADRANGPELAPGLTRYEPVVLERARTRDTAFQAWADAVAERSTAEFRRDVAITLLDDRRDPVVRIRLRNCWPSRYSPLGPLDADAGLLALETLTLEYEGFDVETE